MLFIEQKRFKPSEAAKILGVHPWTLRRWIREGRAPAIKSETGRLYISSQWIEQQLGVSAQPEDIRCALYVRESSSENKAAMQSQLDGLKRYAQAKGYKIVRVVSEIASGVNDERAKLHDLLQKRDFDVLLVEHKDRLSRFGFRWFETLCPFRIEVINVAQNRVNDLMEDLTAILTSFAARLYGQRRGSKKTEAAIRALKET